MFVAWRDLRFARGRFALVAAVIVLITVLVGLLSGLTAGLGRENTSAITDLPADHLAFAAPAAGEEVSFADSRVPEQVWRSWGDRPGVLAADPVAISTMRAESERGSASVSVFGVSPGSRVASAVGDVAPGTVVLSEGAAADLGVAAGDRLRVSDHDVEVRGVSGDASYSHTPVVWATLGDPVSVPPASEDRTATVVALTTTDGADLAAGDTALDTRTTTLADSLSAIGSYQAENSSLQLMRGFLFAISALVIGAFFTVWTIQRSADIAVLKALGASTGYLVRDAIGQAVVLLVGGTTVGTGLAVGLGALIGDAVPFVLTPGTVLVPALVMILLGALGAALSLRRVTAVDPLTALGSAR